MQKIEEKVDMSKEMDASLVDTTSSGRESKEQDTSSRVGNDAHVDDAHIRPIYDEEPMAEPWFASQVDVNNNLPKPVTTHYFPREREYSFAKPHHMITPSSSRYSSNDMIHNHYLEEAKKKTQESGSNSRLSMMPSATSQSMANYSKPKPSLHEVTAVKVRVNAAKLNLVLLNAKSLHQAVEKRFGGNAANKKTQRNLLKQEHENFTTSSLEVNKLEIDILSLDDLYNNLNTNTQNVAFVSLNNTCNTNEAVNTAHSVTTASTQATAVNLTTIDNLSYDVICSFFVSQPNCPQLNNEDLQQIHPDDLEEMDLRLQMAMVTMKAMRFLKNTRSDQAEDGLTNFVLMAYSSISSNSEIIDKCKTSLGYIVVPPPHTGKILPLKPDLFGLEEFENEPIVTEPTVKKPTVKTSEAKASADKLKVVRKNFGPLLIEDWISDSEDEAELNPKIKKKTVKPSFAKIEFVKSKEQVKSPRKTSVKQPVVARNQSNGNACTKACDDADYGFQPSSDGGKKVDEDQRQESECKDQEKENNVNNTNNVNVVSTNGVNVVSSNTNNELPFDPDMPTLENISTFNFSNDHEDVDEEADMNNMDTTIQVSPNPTIRIYKHHPLDQVIGDLHSTTQTRHISKNLEEHGEALNKKKLLIHIRFVCYKEMDQDSAYMVVASKVPMLKPGEYKLWRMRMEQYIQMVNYSLWDVIENGNAPPITKVVKGVETTIAPATAEEKAQRRLELKARSTLLMGILNEHKLKFNFIKDAKSLLQAIEKRFGGNGVLSSKKSRYQTQGKQEELYMWKHLTSAALVSCDGLGGYDWSDQAKDGPTNFALMAYSSTSSNFE
nr:hypothetical protein [Tanacetum cinerariifolium]